MDNVSMLKKIRCIFDRKQKFQLLLLGIMIFIGGFLETLGVGAMMPVVMVLITPETLLAYIQKYDFLQKICDFFHIQNVSQITIALLLALMAVYVIKNLYILLLTYKQNAFIDQNRNRMISRVMAEFLNRPYEQYLGADIPTVFRITDNDIPHAFSLMLSLIQLASEVVVSGLIFVMMLILDAEMTLFVIVLFGVLTLLIIKVFKPRLNKIGSKNQSIQSRIDRKSVV